MMLLCALCCLEGIMLLLNTARLASFALRIHRWYTGLQVASTSKLLAVLPGSHAVTYNNHSSSEHSVVHSKGTSVSTDTSAASIILQLLTNPPNAIGVPSATKAVGIC